MFRQGFSKISLLQHEKRKNDDGRQMKPSVNFCTKGPSRSRYHTHHQEDKDGWTDSAAQRLGGKNANPSCWPTHPRMAAIFFLVIVVRREEGGKRGRKRTPHKVPHWWCTCTNGESREKMKNEYDVMRYQAVQLAMWLVQLMLHFSSIWS